MNAHQIKKFEILKLWGYKNFSIDFHEDVNIIVGPNASGKTTVLNLLRYILTIDIINLFEIDFSQATIILHDFENNSNKKITVVSKSSGYEYKIGEKTYPILLSEISRAIIDEESYSRRIIPAHYRRYSHNLIPPELRLEIESLVPTVWLPVSRRLPISEDQDDLMRRKQTNLESVDKRLGELIGELKSYRLKLDTKLAIRYKKFERQVLQMILFSKDHDKFDLQSMSLPTTDDKEQLIRAFKSAGLFDDQMNKRIEEHFKVAIEAINRLMSTEAGNSIDVDDVFILPLIFRTKSIVEFARQLECDRDNLFKPLKNFEEISQSYLTTKLLKVEENGGLSIKAKKPKKELNPDHLSSGEKQILILLIQALLWEDQPVVYIADEPELSLHVKWQEKLIESLLELGGKIQIIVATHSPDIVGKFVDKVISLGEKNGTVH
jgi:predicted ATP-dependent endonuclease of OLD family